MLFQAKSMVALLAAVAISQGTIFRPNVVGRQDTGLGGILGGDNPTDSSSSATSASSTTSTSSTDSSSSTTTSSSSSSSTTQSSTSTTTTTSSTTTSTSKTSSDSSSTTSSPSQASSTAPPTSTTQPPTTSSTTTSSSSSSDSSTSSSASPSTTPSLTDNGSSGSSGLNPKTKNTIIGVVVGVGGFIALAALGLVAFRIWGRKKVDEDNDGLMSYQIGNVGPEKTGSATGGAATNPFQSTLENYHNPARNVNASSNF